MPITVNMRGKIRPNPDGLFASSNVYGHGGSAGYLSVSGTRSHGSTITITDSRGRFGTRTNVKPLYVALGNQKAGSSLGRMTGDYFHSSATVSSASPIGGLSQCIQFDCKASSADAWGQDLFTFDESKVLYQYVERYYDFDITVSQYQNASGGFNLKTNRIWATVGQNNDIYVGYQGSETNSQRIYCEHVSGNWPADYTNKGLPGFQWLSEQFIFKNSSSVDAADAYYDMYRDNRLQNTLGHVFVTRSTDRPTALNNLFLDQVSNECGNGVSNVYIRYGYMCIDDEPKQIYLHDSPTRVADHKMIPMPQTAWSNNSISFQAVYSHLPISGSYAHIMVGENTWLEAVRL